MPLREEGSLDVLRPEMKQLKLCGILFHEMYVTFLPTVKNNGFQPCLQGNNNLISSIIYSSVILYGETPDEGWGG